MPDTTDEFNLPARLLSMGKPVEGNPFPASDVRHRVWYDASLNAEEAVSRLNSEFVKSRDSDVDSSAEWMIGLFIRKFDIWATRSIQVVWSYEEVRYYDRWLFKYANAWLDNCRKTGHFSHDTLLEFRSQLVERVQWWKVEVRTCLAKQQINSARAAKAIAPSRSPNPGRRNECHNSLSNAVRRRQIVLQNAHSTAKQLCGVFDKNKISMPESWHEVTWANAYKNPMFRARILTIISIDKTVK
jgi:hypothetical protein